MKSKFSLEDINKSTAAALANSGLSSEWKEWIRRQINRQLEGMKKPETIYINVRDIPEKPDFEAIGKL